MVVEVGKVKMTEAKETEAEKNLQSVYLKLLNFKVDRLVKILKRFSRTWY